MSNGGIYNSSYHGIIIVFLAPPTISACFLSCFPFLFLQIELITIVKLLIGRAAGPSTTTSMGEKDHASNKCAVRRPRHQLFLIV